MRTAVVAAAVAYSVDDKGILWLRAYDASGYLICVCMVGEEGVVKLVDYICDVYYGDDDDEIGPVAGNA